MENHTTQKLRICNKIVSLPILGTDSCFTPKTKEKSRIYFMFLFYDNVLVKEIGFYQPSATPSCLTMSKGR